MPNLKVENLGASLKILMVDNSDLTKDKRFTFLTEDVVATGSTIRVQSLIGFESLDTSSGQILCIGEIGNERTEILRTSNSTALSTVYKQVALQDTMLFDHPQDTKVYIIDWNRIEFDYAGSATGSKSTLLAYPIYIQPDSLETVFREKNKDQVFYFARFNDTIESRNSDWSDPVFSSGYDDNTVFAIKQRALDELDEVIDGDIITDDFLNQQLWEARREFHQSIGKRPFRRKFNVDIGNVTTGMYRIEMPSDVEDPYSAENIYGVRIGTEKNLEYYDKKEWDFDFRDKPHTTLVTTYQTTHQDLFLSDVRDFDDSGSVTIENDTIAYSAKGVSGGTLRISTAGSSSHSSGLDVWQNASYGLPDKFTVWFDVGGSAYIYFNRPVESAYVNQNIYADYYRTLVGYDSDADVLDEPIYDFYVHYLMAKIKHRKNKGLGDITQDPDYKLWEIGKQKALATEYLGVDIRFKPETDHLSLPY